MTKDTILLIEVIINLVLAVVVIIASMRYEKLRELIFPKKDEKDIHDYLIDMKDYRPLPTLPGDFDGDPIKVPGLIDYMIEYTEGSWFKGFCCRAKNEKEAKEILHMAHPNVMIRSIHAYEYSPIIFYTKEDILSMNEEEKKKC